MIALLEYRAKGWPDNPLDAAAAFHRDCATQVREYAAMKGLAADIAAHAPPPFVTWVAVIIVFPHADFMHSEWRKIAIQELARESVPMRVNGIEASMDEEIRPVVDYLASAPGVTGQMFRTDGNFCADR